MHQSQSHKRLWLMCFLGCILSGRNIFVHKKRKLSYPENMPYDPSEENIINGHGKEGFIKAGVYFFFDKTKIDFTVIGNVNVELYLRLMEYIRNMNPEDIRYVVDNLT